MSDPAFEIDIDQAEQPIVLALDVGSTASRGALYDAAGRPAGKRAKRPHAFTTAADGTSTIDPDEVVAELTAIIEELLEQVGDTTVGGVAIDTFASSLVGVAEDGSPLTPCITYADARCADEVAACARSWTRRTSSSERAPASTRAISRRGCGGSPRSSPTWPRR